MKVIKKTIIPVNDYFSSLPKWDGTDHIEKLTGYIEVPKEDKERFRKQIKKMLVRIVATYLGNNPNHSQFVLVDNVPESSSGNFLRWLCPESLDAYYCDNINLHADGLRDLVYNFIINIEKLSCLNVDEIDELYKHIRTDYVTIISPGKKRKARYLKNCSFLGSTKNVEFLRSFEETCNFNCFLVTKIDWNFKNNLDINKIWGQAYHLFQNKFNYQFTIKEMRETEKSNGRLLKQMRSSKISIMPDLFSGKIEKIAVSKAIY